MGRIVELMATQGLAPALGGGRARSMAKQLGSASRTEVYPESVTVRDGVLFFLARQRQEKVLGLIGDSADLPFDGSLQRVGLEGRELDMKLCPKSPENAVALRDCLPFTVPGPLGPGKSMGFGDRLGLATPGHAQAAKGTGLRPVFAQQSIREMERTGRTPRQVIDDACWGVLQAGWREGFGADADHLKTTGDVDRCLEAGFTFFTIDPSDHVDDSAAGKTANELQSRLENLPWLVLESSFEDMRRRYAGKQLELGSTRFEIRMDDLVRSVAKYAAAVAHTVVMYRHLMEKAAGRSFELEVSVDETDSPTAIVEHFFVAAELSRLGVKLDSLAPRFEGRFEKGVDYIGEISGFETCFEKHVALAEMFGSYKIGIHSGSDKFSIYPVMARHAANLHLKTAGTSYLEALRVIAAQDPGLFAEILDFARRRFPRDRASYHVSAQLEKIPAAGRRGAQELAGLLDDFHARQVLHVTFGSVLSETRESGEQLFSDRIYEVLSNVEELYYSALLARFEPHVTPFRG